MTHNIELNLKVYGLPKLHIFKPEQANARKAIDAWTAEVPDAKRGKHKTKLSSTEKVRRFAKKLGIHPAIIAGRLRFERKNHRIFRTPVSSEVQLLN